MAYDATRLEIYKHRLVSVAEEMGVVLQRAAYSPNIKERRDFSCALFDSRGEMVAQAAHIPVHLGAMSLAVKAARESCDFKERDMVILNDPFKGGTHLPDITLISPVLVDGTLFAFVACRAHHADVGGASPGSMPLSRELFQEGLIIPPLKLVKQGQLNAELLSLLLANVRTSQERLGDLRAQIAANRRGERRIRELVSCYGSSEVGLYMENLLLYTERTTRGLLERLPDGEYAFVDYLDGEGAGGAPVKLAVRIVVKGDEGEINFAESSPQSEGNLNVVYGTTLAAVYYVFRSLLDRDIPSNSGCLRPLRLVAPPGTVVNARPPAAVAAGSVETSQRLVDVLLGALAQACPRRVPAASQGTMNNLTFGGWDEERQRPFTYYETIGGGTGALNDASGEDAVQSHMTNTLNTPVEALEYAYPLRVRRYAVRRGSGGSGRHKGGDGIEREMESLSGMGLTILSERRRRAPYGLCGGGEGARGENILICDGKVTPLSGKVSLDLKAGDVVRVLTPGGGAYGLPDKKE